MANLRVKAAEIHDPREMLERISYRNGRLHDRIEIHDDPVRFARMMASRNRSDLRHLAELLGYASED